MARKPEVKWTVVYQRTMPQWLGHEVEASNRPDANQRFGEWVRQQPDDGMGYEIISTNTINPYNQPGGLYVMDTVASAKVQPRVLPHE